MDLAKAGEASVEEDFSQLAGAQSEKVCAELQKPKKRAGLQQVKSSMSRNRAQTHVEKVRGYCHVSTSTCCELTVRRSKVTGDGARAVSHDQIKPPLGWQFRSRLLENAGM